MSIKSITENFKNFILDKYSEGGISDSKNKVFFESLGSPITENDITDFSFSSLVNTYPDTDNESYSQNNQKLDELYKIILSGCTLLPNLDATSFNRTKSNALKDIETFSLASPSGIAQTFLKSDQQPSDWFSNDDYWKPYSSGKVKNDLELKTLEDSGKSSDLLIGKDISDEENSSRNVSVKMNSLRNLNVISNIPTTNDVDVSLEYCIVKIDRKWLSNAILNLYDNWYLPNFLEGSLALNPIDFQFLPIAMIVIRKFEIKADWTDPDASKLNQVNALGFFSLAGSNFVPEQGKLSNSQSQIIGWVCTPVKNLPPVSDPSVKETAWINIQHDGLYVAKFEVTWSEKNTESIFEKKAWKSGNKTIGYDYNLILPIKSKDITITGWAKTGLIWDPWNQIMAINESKPTNKTYKVTGTTLINDCIVI